MLAGLAYAMLASAMPRAGGSYVYASRGLSPYLGFVASFSQWFSLCVAIGVVSFLIMPFLRDIAVAAGVDGVAATLEAAPIRLAISLACLWAAVVRQPARREGLRAADGAADVPDVRPWRRGDRRRLPFDHGDFAAALQAREGRAVAAGRRAALPWSVLLPASALLFASFIGFDSIAQAGGRGAAAGPRSAARHRHLPSASVGVFYMLFTARGVPRRAVGSTWPPRRSAAT